MKWPEGISDGLTLPCRRCGVVPSFDHTVASGFWRQVVPEKWRSDVVCLPCLDVMSYEKGMHIEDALERVQFTGRDVTVLLVPVFSFRHGRERR